MKYELWLSNIDGISNGKIRKIQMVIPTAEELYGCTSSQLSKIYGLTEQDIFHIKESRKSWDLDKEWYYLQENGISFVSMEQQGYPNKLRTIANPPYSVYYKGKLPREDVISIAIVGARGRTAYGCEFAQLLAETLGNNGIQVISGLARGIDSDSHKGVLKVGGDTYAVLGNGVSICYPEENQYLYNEIIEKGGIISEYTPNTKPNAKLFPARNRLISGLSDCVVVVEAGLKSGSLITADYAIEQGKDVYVLPGRTTDRLSSGCNQLIKQGAGIILNIEDFVEELKLLFGKNVVMQRNEKNPLEKDERLVYSLFDFSPIGLAFLLEKTKLPIAELLSILQSLKYKGYIRERIPNFYTRTL